MSYRDTQEDNYNQRLLANVVESDMQNDEEREYLRKYKQTLQNLKREQKELSKTKRRIKELSAQEGTTNTATIDDLEETAQDIKTLILHYENYLLKLEITPPLSEVIERESVKAYLKQQEKEAEEIIKRYDEQRQEALKRLNEQEAKQNKEPIIVTPQQVQKRESPITIFTVALLIIVFLVAIIVSHYDTDNINPPTDETLVIMPEPSNGYIFDDGLSSYEKLAPLSINTGGTGGYYVILDPICLYGDWDDSFLSYRAELYAKYCNTKFYVRAGSTAEILVPLGEYEIYYAMGENWYGESELFGEDTIYNKCEGTFSFYQTETSYSGWSLEFTPVINGNLDVDKIDAEDFPK